MNENHRIQTLFQALAKVSKEAGERGALSWGEDWTELVLRPIQNVLEGRGLIPMFRSASRLRGFLLLPLQDRPLPLRLFGQH